MTYHSFSRLLSSLATLEAAIATARQAMAGHAVSADLVRRLECYEEVVKKQQTLTRDLAVQLIARNQQEIDRIMRLINGLSYLIRDDASEIVGILSASSADVTPVQVIEVCH